MKKLIFAFLISMSFIFTACGELNPTDVTGVARVTINGEKFEDSVDCNITEKTKLSIVVSATSKSGKSFNLAASISKDGKNFKFIEGDDYTLNYEETSSQSYIAIEDNGGSITATFNNDLYKVNFDITATQEDSGEEKNIKGEIECTPNGAVAY